MVRKVLIGAFIVVAGLAIFAIKFKSSHDSSIDILSAVYSGLAVLGVAWAVATQKQELIAATEAFKEQGKTLSKQRFENTFFELVKVHNEKSTRFSRDRIQSLINAIGNTMQSIRVKERREPTQEEAFELVKMKPEHQYQILFAPYIANLFNILSIITTSTLIDTNDKVGYFQIVRGLLDSMELDLVILEAKQSGVLQVLTDYGFFKPSEEVLLKSTKQPQPGII